MAKFSDLISAFDTAAADETAKRAAADAAVAAEKVAVDTLNASHVTLAAAVNVAKYVVQVSTDGTVRLFVADNRGDFAVISPTPADADVPEAPAV